MLKCNHCREALKEGEVYRLVYVNGKEEWVHTFECYDENLVKQPLDYVPWHPSDPD